MACWLILCSQIPYKRHFCAAEKNIIVDMTDKFTFTNKKPNMQVVDTDEKGVFNFHFPSNAKCEQGFEKAVSLM